MTEKAITVFAYDFEHRKTYDFLTILKSFGFNNVCVIGAPKVELKSKHEPYKLESIKIPSMGIGTEELCRNLGYKYLRSPHNEFKNIQQFIDGNSASGLAIISGARILPAETIKLFKHGIINFHPGSIPETSGLDSFFWMMKNKSKPGTTVHYIDHRVDAGRLIFFHNVGLSINDNLTTLNTKIYYSQTSALIRLLKVIKHSWDIPSTEADRPKKNKPMGKDMKLKVIQDYRAWLLDATAEQGKISQAYKACECDNVIELGKLYQDNFFNYKCNQGRTLLAVSAYNQSLKCMKFLIEKGSDVNAVNDKGTSVLMYAKTKLLNKPNANKGILELLVKNGANRDVKDSFGKNIYDYINSQNDRALSNYIERL